MFNDVWKVFDKDDVFMGYVVGNPDERYKTVLYFENGDYEQILCETIARKEKYRGEN